MNRLLFEHADLQIWQRGDSYYARYDAGSHAIVMREDQISQADAEEAVVGVKNAERVLLRLQARLLKQDINPYISNISNCS